MAATVGRRPRVIPRRTHRAYIWLTADEHALVAAVAARDRMTVGGFAAETAVAVARGHAAPVPASRADQWRALSRARLDVARLRDGLQTVAEALAAAGVPAPVELRVVLRTVEATVNRLDEATVALQPPHSARN
jgi:hypothetical protein